MSEKQVVLIVGGSRGIGGSVAKKLAADGHDVAIMARNDDTNRFAEKIGAFAFQGSLLNPDDINQFVEKSVEKYGRVDAVLNSTGHVSPSYSTAPSSVGFDADLAANGHLLDIPDDTWHAALNMYFLNIVRMARAVTPYFEKQNKGSIVNVSAFTINEPVAYYPLGIVNTVSGFAKLYADRYAPNNIRMNNMVLGFLENHQYPDSLFQHIPMNRAGKLDGEIAETIAFLLSDKAGYITGQNIVADGGMARAH